MAARKTLGEMTVRDLAIGAAVLAGFAFGVWQIAGIVVAIISAGG
jgi:hypothetical protein